MEYPIHEITNETVISDCKTPSDIISKVLSLINAVDPKETQFKHQQIKNNFEKGMNEYQVAYGLAESALKSVKNFSNHDYNMLILESGLELKRGEEHKKERDKIFNLKIECDNKYNIGSFQYCKLLSEEMMVKNMFEIMENYPSTKKQIAEREEDYLKIKNNWRKPVCRSEIIKLAFKMKND